MSDRQRVLMMTQNVAWVHVRAPGRLHFGLLALPHAVYATHWPDVSGRLTIPRRTFGGVGLMIEQPGVELTVRRAAAWSARGPQADRVLALPLAQLPGPCEIVI